MVVEIAAPSRAWSESLRRSGMVCPAGTTDRIRYNGLRFLLRLVRYLDITTAVQSKQQGGAAQVIHQ
jgi:hypothetical protein